MNENDLAEVEVEQEGLKIKLVKKGQGVVAQVITPVAGNIIAASSSSLEGQEVKPVGKEIKSPMVGTFYRSPSPETDAYVQVGDIISKGDVLCIVEAMKLMNEVKAECGGRIMEICVENAEPVEFGQPLFILEAA